MVTLLAGYTGPLHREDLKAEGFTDQEIDRLIQLRRVWPNIEYHEPDEWRRIQFLKWRYQRGQVRQ